MNPDRQTQTEKALAEIRRLAEDWIRYHGSHIHQNHGRQMLSVLDRVK